jgi:hypothetical protein
VTTHRDTLDTEADTNGGSTAGAVTVATRNPARSDLRGAGHEPTGPEPAGNEHIGQDPARRELPVAPRTSRGRGWALAGIGSALAGFAMVVTTSMVDAVYDERLFGDPQGVVARLAGKEAPILAFHVTSMIGAVLMVVFAAGLHRRLRERLGDGSTAPLLAFAGLLGTAVVTVLGTGLDTEFVFAFGEKDMIDPANAAMFNHWIGTVPWCWALVGLSALAVFVAGRLGGVPRWIGRTGLVLGGLTLLLGISPLQYMAGAVGPLWLLVTAVGFAAGDRAFRGTR